MKYSVRKRKELIAELLPMLADKEVKVRELKGKDSGASLMAQGVEFDRSGAPLVRGKIYETFTPVMGLVNHSRKIENIIKDAKTEMQLENDLALYLVQNAKSKEAIQNGQ